MVLSICVCVGDAQIIYACIADYPRYTDQRQAAFRKAQIYIDYPHSIMLNAANATRWNSYFLTINDALNMRKGIEHYINDSLTGTTMHQGNSILLLIILAEK